MKLNIFASLLLLPFFALPVTAETVTSTTTTQGTVRPDGRDSVSVQETLGVNDGHGLSQSVTTGYTHFFNPDGEDTSIVPLKYTITNTDGQRVTVSGTIGGYVRTTDGQTFPALQFSATIPVGNSATLTGTAGYDLMQDTNRTVEAGLQKVTLSPQIRWEIDPRTRVLVMYQVAFIDDGNTQHRVQLRIEHNLGSKGAYVAGNFSYLGNEQDSTLYWTPRNYFANTVELGWRFPITSDLSAQVGVAPTYVINEGDSKFRIGGGAGLRWTPNPDQQVEASVQAGYGVTTRLSFRQLF